MWEQISDNNIEKSNGAVFKCVTDRLKVPKGWLVRSMLTSYDREGGASVDQTFVSDPKHTWKIKK